MKPSAKETTDKLRLQVFLSRNGVCSRRKAMDLIFSKEVSVNGKVVTEPSFSVDELKDKVTVSGRDVDVKKFTYILLNKPAGYVTTKSDVFAEKIITDLLPEQYRYVSPVGRLDKDTEGLLLLTNDGDLAFHLTHPRHHIDKVYFVQINGELASIDKKKLETGIMLDEVKTSSARIEILKTSKQKTDLTITIHEGRKRQVRRMFDFIGRRVVYLKRVKEGNLSIDGLNTGQWRMLSQKEIEGLKSKI
jgi:pseudouridine synthase